MQRIVKRGQAEQTINKSRFIAVAEYCDSERAVAISLRKLASANQNAHHLAYAFRIKTDQGIIQRFSDAGEPSGTAGKPILQFIEGRGLINVCVGVIRYYGGINLGTGGLARAYGGTAKMALEAATIMPYVEMQQIRVVLDYKSLDNFTRDLTKLNGEILDKQFGEYVELVASLPASEAEAFKQRYSTS
ncbi:MAG TPA: YigZ family protein [Methylophilaceae bacterium]